MLGSGYCGPARFQWQTISASTWCCLIRRAVGVAFPAWPPGPRVGRVFGAGVGVGWGGGGVATQGFLFHAKTEVQEGKPTHGNTFPTTARVICICRYPSDHMAELKTHSASVGPGPPWGPVAPSWRGEEQGRVILSATAGLAG